jgi:predicted MFS family arabinose efflux permease
MDMRLFRHYSFTMANLFLWFTTAILYGSLFLVPFFFEQAEKLSALATGEILILQGLAMIVGLAISGKLYNTVGPRILSVVGIAIVAVSLFGFTHLTVTTTGADMQPWLILSGIGMGLIAQPAQTLAISAVSNQQMAKASSLISSTRMIFGAVGVAIFTTYLTQQTMTHAGTIAAGFKTQPLSGIAATCAQQAGQNLNALHACLGAHAATMGLNDTFPASLIGCVVCTLFTFFIGRDRALEGAKAAKRRGGVVEKQPMTMLDH